VPDTELPADMDHAWMLLDNFQPTNYLGWLDRRKWGLVFEILAEETDNGRDDLVGSTRASMAAARAAEDASSEVEDDQDDQDQQDEQQHDDDESKTQSESVDDGGDSAVPDAVSAKAWKAACAMPSADIHRVIRGFGRALRDGAGCLLAHVDSYSGCARSAGT